uniref:Uncharacterized protein n=1 Tax=Faecalibaculum rodentium TaxID=1702221 RepID=A0A140DS83_9FIRM|nr:hypothetical protein AALO17_03760 [Faecalibaculum rodentium]
MDLFRRWTGAVTDRDRNRTGITSQYNEKMPGTESSFGHLISPAKPGEPPARHHRAGQPATGICQRDS